MEIWVLAAAVACLVLALLVILIGRHQSQGREEAQTLVSSLADLQGRLAALSDAQAAQYSQLASRMEERLDTVSQRIGHNLSESASKTAESLGNLQQRLVTIDEAQKNITQLSSQVVSLQDILANKQARGAFGQQQMENIIRDGLPPSIYSFQPTLSNGKRPDCLIRLPNTQEGIVIDAKFPLEAFNELRAAQDQAVRRASEQRVRADVGKHISDIAEKYLIPGETQDPAIMFVPSESVYAELHDSFSDLIQKGHRAHVIIVSPNMLMLAINTIQAVLKDAKMREQASRIQYEVSLLLEDVRRLQDRVSNLQRHFGQAEEDIRKIVTSAEKISRRGYQIEEVELGDPKSLEEDSATSGRNQHTLLADE